MHRFFALILMSLTATPGQAEDCPPYYRFVDFGLTDREGHIHRGGNLFRVEGFDGVPTLIREQTQCKTVNEMSVDGHAHPIPVVTHFAYDPARTLPFLTDFHIFTTLNATERAQTNAERHRARLRQPTRATTQGETYLCVGDPQELSCQIQSPYPGNLPVVIYCDEQRCEMPVLSFNDKIIIRASWPNTNAAGMSGEDISRNIMEIHNFLVEQY